MSEAFHTETIDTDAGTYTVNLWTDDYSEQPYDYGWTFYMPESDWRIRIDTTDAAEKNELPYLAARVINDAVKNGGRYYTDTPNVSGRAIIRYLRLKGLRATLTRDYHRIDDTDEFDGIVIAPHDIPDEHLTSAFDSFLGTWRAWSEGDVFGYTVLAPNGDVINSCSGYYGFDREQSYVMDEARAAVKNDVAERTEKSNLVGAGIIGLI